MIYEYDGHFPKVHSSSFVASSAELIGKVFIEEDANIWYGAVLRADINKIVIGRGSNVQDRCVFHVAEVYPTEIGEYVTVGHSAIVHACKVGNYSLIGMGAIILNGAEIGDYTIVGAGSVVTPNTKIPSGVLAMGTPAKVIRELSKEEKKKLEKSAVDYIELAKKYQ